MIFFLALIPATMLTIAGYFVLILAPRAEGGLRAFGRYLGFWAFTLAGLVLLASIFAAAHLAHRGPHAGMWGPHGGFYRPWVREPFMYGPEEREAPPAGTGPHEALPPPGEAPHPPGSPNPAPPETH
jgi:hypothetical protein